MASREKADALLAQIRELTAAGDDKSLKRAAELSRALTLALEKPEETAVQLGFMPLQVLSTRIAIDLHLFKVLVASNTDTSLAELGSKCGAEELLLERVLRVLSLIGFVDEVGERTWRANAVTRAMAVPAIEGSHKHLWDMTFNSAAKGPEYLKKVNYKCPTDPHDGILQYAYNTKMSGFEFWSSNPSTLDDFNNMMTGVRHSRPSWIEWYPVQERLLAGYRADTTLLVDVGGCGGHDLVDFQRKFAPTERLVLEDLEHVTSKVGPLPSNVEVVTYDFFGGSQPVKGARAYFFHFIFHDWSDEKCLLILRNMASAMTPGYSKILLNEYILRDAGCSMQHALMDMNMLTICSGMERTEKQWRRLIEQAGLKVVKMWRPDGDTEGIVEIEV